ncbi:MAG: hypothetical protein K6A92_10800 [Lachnospiraceae bacterium]|nr:hypothetical protein [Lachnospiraceae bacterium]
MSASDRQAIQNEVEQLQAEITRVAKETEFNSQTLMDGSFDLKGFTNNLTTKVVTYSDTVPTGKYTLDSLTVVYGEEGKITDAVKTGTDLGPEYKIEATDDDKVTISGENDFAITLSFPTPEEMAAFDFSALTPTTTTTTTTPTANGESVVVTEEYTINQNGYQGTYIRTTTTLNETVDGVENQTVTVEENYALTGTEEGKEGTYNMVTTSTTQTTGIGTETKTVNGTYVLTGLELDITNLGAMRLQVGANENQVINVRIPKVSLETLGIDDMDIKTEKTATEAITKISGAIDYISAERSRLGAYQNRLESNIANLDVSAENMTSAYSRIMDVDMAEEMTQYSTYQVLTQTSTSMLAQANDRPSQVLQILQ